MLPVVWPDFHAAKYRRIEPEVLLHGAPAAVLDRGAALDDEGDRRGPTLGRLLEGVSHERARCLRGVPIAGSPLHTPDDLRTSATLLDCGASLDDEGDRRGPTLGRLLEGVSHERARCLRGHSDLTDIPDS